MMQVVAPAGSFSALRSAVNAGADAVYLGLPQFGARAKAENFGRETLRAAVEYAHFFGTEVFVTLNTLIKDSEMSEALELARFACDCGVDAAIVQDLRFIKSLKKNLPKLTLHASTQMGIHNEEGALALRDLGIKRAVLARETLPQDIEKIKRTGLEIEFFVQGALCVCFSGNCYFSSLASSYSGNRGKCMQLCRKKYSLDGRDGYFLSAKDLCLYGDLKRLEDLGVDAIKIEGRMRSDEYVAQAVSVYKSEMPRDKAVDALKSVFNRGDYINAYLDKDAPFRVIHSKSQGNIGKFVGKIDVAGNKIRIKGFTPHRDDGFKILRDGCEIGGAHFESDELVPDCKCMSGDELRKTFDGALSERLRTFTRTVPVSVLVEIEAEKKPRVVLSARGITVSVTGSFTAQRAKTRGITVDDVYKAFRKVSDYPFLPELDVKTASDVFMPISALNDLRRQAYGELYGALLNSYAVKTSDSPFIGLNYNKFDGSGSILTVEDLDILSSDILDRVDYIALNPRDYSSVPDIKPNFDKPILLNLPVVMRGADVDIIKRAVNAQCISGVISNNLYSLKLTDKPILLGAGHNIIGKCGLPHIKSFEADSIDGDSFAYVFGYAPVMTLCHCIYGKCKNCDGDDRITDESGRQFKLRKVVEAHCYWQLLNCVPHCLTDIKSIGKNRLYDCTSVAPEEIIDVLDGKYAGKYTRGNLNKGLK